VVAQLVGRSIAATGGYNHYNIFPFSKLIDISKGNDQTQRPGQ
jgi:hypothetical protein